MQQQGNSHVPACQPPTDISVALKGQSTLAKKPELAIASIGATDEALEDGEETVWWKSKIKAKKEGDISSFFTSAVVNVGNCENWRKKMDGGEREMP